MNEISGFGVVFLFFMGGIVFILVTLLAGKILRPNRPNQEKLTTYESGEEPSGAAWSQFNVRFYIVALVFLLFEAELVFLFPWAIVFGNEDLVRETDGLWASFTIIEAFIFISILVLGLAYVWANGMLAWVKPEPKQTDFKSKIPTSAYSKFN